ncbi:hypothetical protein Dimus_009207 [Dionaea muscipula]
MERAKEMLQIPVGEAESVRRLIVHPHRAHIEPSFYEDFALRGIRVDRVEPGLVVCTFKVPPRLTDRTGILSVGAIVNLVDEVGGSLIFKAGHPTGISVNMSVSNVSTANVDDELEVTCRLLGQKGNLLSAVVIVKQKVTGEIVAEGRHTIFCKQDSKI